MIGDKSVLTIITARGGSKGLPKKNIKVLHNKPLINWTIEAALNSQYIDKLIVSTDCPEIGRVSVDAGAEVPFLRPSELAMDTSKQEDAILHAMAWVKENEKQYDYVMVLVPTTPLRPTREIDDVVNELLSNPDARAIFTVRECEHSPIQSNTLPKNNSMAGFVPEQYKLKNRQELPTYYQLSGSVCVSDWEWFESHKTFLTDKTFAYKTSAKNGLDIDSLADFLLAEVYLNNPEL